jgi:hypothetical protein
MENKNSKIIASKEKLAAEVLEVAQDARGESMRQH